MGATGISVADFTPRDPDQPPQQRHLPDHRTLRRSVATKWTPGTPPETTHASNTQPQDRGRGTSPLQRSVKQWATPRNETIQDAAEGRVKLQAGESKDLFEMGDGNGEARDRRSRHVGTREGDGHG